MQIVKWIIAVLVFYIVFFFLFPLLALPAGIMTVLKIVVIIGAIIWAVKQLE